MFCYLPSSRHENFLEKYNRVQRELASVPQAMSENARNHTVVEDRVTPLVQKLQEGANHGVRLDKCITLPLHVVGLHKQAFLPLTRLELSPRWKDTVWYGMVWYGMVWYGMDSQNMRCTLVDKCAATRAPPAQCPLAGAPASVRPKRGAPVIAACHRARLRSKPALHMPVLAVVVAAVVVTAAVETATAVTAAVVPAVAVSTADIRACSLSVGTSLFPVTTSLGDLHSATRSLASALCCGVTVTGLRARGILLGESEVVVQELTVTTGIDRFTIHELLLNQRRQVANGDEPGTFEGTRGRKARRRINVKVSAVMKNEN